MVWDLARENVEVFLENSGEVSQLRQLPDGRLAIGFSNGSILLKGFNQIDEDDRQLEQNVLFEHTREINCLRVIGANRLASASSDNDIRIWDVQERACVATLNGHIDEVIALKVLN